MGIGYDYSLIEKGTFGIEYSLTVFSDKEEAVNYGGSLSRIEEERTLDLINALRLSYDITNRVSFNIRTPYVYSHQSGDPSVSDNGFGDLAAGFKINVLEESAGAPLIHLLITYSAPTGSSPYKINPYKEIATGAGHHALELGAAFSKSYGTLLPFLGLACRYGFPQTDLNSNRYFSTLNEVKPGFIYSLEAGLTGTLNETISCTAAIAYAYQTGGEDVYAFGRVSREDIKTGTVALGAGIKVANVLICPKVGIGITDESPDLMFNLKIPFAMSLK